MIIFVLTAYELMHNTKFSKRDQLIAYVLESVKANSDYKIWFNFNQVYLVTKKQYELTNNLSNKDAFLDLYPYFFASK